MSPLSYKESKDNSLQDIALLLTMVNTAVNPPRSMEDATEQCEAIIHLVTKNLSEEALSTFDVSKKQTAQTINDESKKI